MTLIGYTMMGEQAGPKQLVRDVALPVLVAAVVVALAAVALRLETDEPLPQAGA